MTYLISHEFYHGTPYYVRTGDGSTFEEVYNPKFATQFATEVEAQKWIDTWSSLKDFSTVVDYEESAQRFEEWAKDGMVRRTLACINRAMSRKYNNEPLAEVVDWWIYATINDDEIDYEDYETWPDLYSISKHLHEVQSCSSGDFETIDITFQIYTSQNGNFDEFQSELNLVLDKVTLRDEDGFLILPILDHHLSEGGNSASLMIHPETKKVRVEGRWTGEEFSSLEEAFEFMKRERYYE